jgi:Gpi18-like mannosyltransferase
MSLSPQDRGSLIRVVCAFLLTRMVLYVTGAIAIRMLPPNSALPAETFLGRNFSLVGWVRWDAGWYLSIVERGYWINPQGPSNVAFFPLLPLLIKLVALLTGNAVVAGLLVVNIAALGATLALWRWVRAEAGPVAAESSVLWLLVYPFSFFLHSIYAETLYFLLVTLALAASSRGHRLTAGLWGFLAALTRPMGMLLTPALAWGLWQDHRAGRPLRRRDVLAVVLPVVGVGVYATYLWIAFGDPLACWTAHRIGWHVESQSTVSRYWLETYEVLTRLVRVHTYSHLFDVMRIVLPPVFVGLTVAVFRRLGSVPGIYASLTVAVSVLFAIESVGREFLAVIPAFAVAGIVLRPGTVAETLRFVSLGFLLLFFFAFAMGRFVG